MLQKRTTLLEPVRGPAWGVTGAERFGAYASSGFFWSLTECFQSPRSSKYGSQSGRWVDPPSKWPLAKADLSIQPIAADQAS